MSEEISIQSARQRLVQEEIKEDIRRLRNMRRRVERARDFPRNTCPASRHLHMIADNLAVGRPYPMLDEEPQHCAETMLSVLESLFKARSELRKLKGDA